MANEINNYYEIRISWFDIVDVCWRSFTEVFDALDECISFVKKAHSSVTMGRVMDFSYKIYKMSSILVKEEKIK